MTEEVSEPFREQVSTLQASVTDREQDLLEVRATAKQNLLWQMPMNRTQVPINVLVLSSSFKCLYKGKGSD